MLNSSRFFILLLVFVTISSFLPMALTTVPVSASSYTMTFYPDVDTESKTVDGRVRHYQLDQTWSTIQGGAGTEAFDTESSAHCAAAIDAGASSNQWSYFYRSIFPFDTSGLPDGATITSANLSLYGYSKLNTLTGTSPTVNIFSAAPASDTGLAAGDYDSLGTTPFSTNITYADWNTSGYNDFPLNSSGLAVISKNGTSNFGFREATYDAPNNEAPWTSGGAIAYFGLYYAEQGSGYQPKLVITYTLPDTYTMTFYPDADPETSSVDGRVRHYQLDQTWSTIQGGAGTEAFDTESSAHCGAAIDAGASSNQWSYFYRSIFLFDTSDLPDGATITSANLSLYGYSKLNTLTGTSPTVNIFSAAPASDTGLAAGDYDSLGTTPFSTNITYADWNTSGYNDFPLNSSGLAVISKNGTSNFGFREATYDAPNNEAPWTSGGAIAYFGLYYAEQGSGYQPKLVVTYTLPDNYTMTLYPSAKPESTSVDGRVRHYQLDQTWSTIQGGAGTEAFDTESSAHCGAAIDAGASSNQWSYFYRSIFLFDTSGLPDGATITSANLSLYGYSKLNTLTGTSPTVNIFSAAPASNTSLAAGDYDSLGTTPFSTNITYADWNTSGYNDFPLNSSGLEVISKTGVSNYGFREATYDAPNNEAPWTSGGAIAYFGLYYAEQGSGYQPKLVVTYTLGGDSTPPAAVNDLAVSSTTSNTITLTWTSPGDDGNTGTASQYDIRYSTSPINESNWASATQVSGEPTPLVAGTSQNFTVTSLSSGTTYYFAIKTADEVPNWSYINCPNGTTS